MSSGSRVGAFGLLLAALFGFALVAGGTADPDPRAATSEPRTGGGEPAAAAAGHGHARATAASPGRASARAEAAQPVRGLAVADGRLALDLVAGDLVAGRPGELAFRIVDRQRKPLRRFEVEHEKRMHLIIVRRDGSGFQHLHPRMDAAGIWRQRVAIREPGSYRVFADFKAGGEATTLAADLHVDGRARYARFPPPATTFRTRSGYEVALQRDGDTVRFAITRAGRTIHTEPYLGAGGHLVALREGDLAYLHTHPADHGDAGHDDRVAFETQFPSAGRYRLYFQFKHEGRVHTAEFTQEVRR